MNPLEPNTDLAVLFLVGLDKYGRHDLVAINPYVPGGDVECMTFLPDQRAAMRAWIDDRQGKRNIYTAVNRARDDAPKNERLHGDDKKKTQLSTIGYLRAVVVDIDPAKIKGGDASGDNFRAERARLQNVAQQIASDPICPPMLMVNSGGGLQAWWQLKAMVPATPENVALYKGIGRTLAKRYGGDSVFSEAQIMRVPGTINVLSPDKKKQGRAPAMCTILSEQSSNKMHTLEGLAGWAPPTPEHTNSEGGPKSAINMEAVEADTYADLPAELREKFEAYRAEYPAVDALWNGTPMPRQSDESPSGMVFALAGVLRGHGDFTITEHAQLVAVWEHQSKNHAHEFERYVANAWNNSRTKIGSIRKHGFDAIEFDESKAPPPSARPSTHSPSGTPQIEWSEPTDLWSARFEAVDLPVGVVPEVIERAARDRAKRLGVEAGACAAALATAIGSLVPAGNQLQMRQHDTDWTVKPILWTAIIGEPGSKKTAIWEQATKAVQSIESNWAKKYAVERLDFDRLNENKKRKTKSAKVAVTETETFVSPPSDLSEDWPDVACEPVRRRKVVQDATTEKLAEILSQNSDGLLFTSDELSGLFGGMDAYRTKGGKDRPFWLQAKEGGVSIIDRMSRDTQRVENTAISVLGGIQPSLLKKLSDDLARDGMLQRFMPIIAKKIGNGEDLVPDKAGTDAVGQITVALVNAEQSGLFKFSPEADSELLRMYAFQEMALAQPGATPTLRQWIDKTAGEFGRLSLVFHFIEWFASAVGLAGDNPPPLVSLATARRARRFLTEFVYPHALVFHQSVLGRSQYEGHTTWIAGYILARELSVVTLRDIYRNYAPFKPVETRAALATVMRGLETDDWLSPCFERQRDGQPTWWNVNPAVHVAFAARAAAERGARAAVQANISVEAQRRKLERLAKPEPETPWHPAAPLQDRTTALDSLA